MLSHSVSATSTKGEEWGNQSQQQQSSFHQMHQSLQYKEFVPQGVGSLWVYWRYHHCFQQPTATQVSGESSPQQQQSIPEFIQQHMQHSGIAVSQVYSLFMIFLVNVWKLFCSSLRLMSGSRTLQSGIHNRCSSPLILLLRFVLITCLIDHIVFAASFV